MTIMMKIFVLAGLLVADIFAGSMVTPVLSQRGNSTAAALVWMSIIISWAVVAVVMFTVVPTAD